MADYNFEQAYGMIRAGVNRMMLGLLLDGGDFRYKVDSTKIDRTKVKSVESLITMIEDEVLKAMRTVTYRKFCRLQQICVDSVKYSPDDTEEKELRAFATEHKYPYGGQVFELREPILKYLTVVDSLHADDSECLWGDMDNTLLKVFELLGEPLELIDDSSN